MPYYRNVLEVIGRTPLIQLSKVTEGLPVTLLAKVEYFNPGGSVKDRVALRMIEDAERRGALRPGGTIIEATAGNTGAGLALVAAVKGYRCIFVLPDKMSEDKVSLLKAYGAEVVITPTSVPPDSPESYNGVAERLAREIPLAFRPNQFDNPENPAAHYNTTGPEIWEDTDGKVDVFVAGMGTGGTISGTGGYLKERNPNVIVVGADPAGSILSGDAPKSYKVEGVGEDFIPATFDRQAIDEMVRVTDAESFDMTRRLAREEGLLVGGSAGMAVAAAIKFGRRLPPGKVIVVLLPDTGRNYLGKIFSDTWMRQNNFPIETPESFTAGDVLNSKPGSPVLISISTERPASDALQLMDDNAISQLPVLQKGRNVGSLNEMTLVKLLHDGVDLRPKKVSDVMGRPMPQVEETTDISEVYRLLMAGFSGVIITRNDTPCGLLARIDLAGFWVKKAKQKEAADEQEGGMIIRQATDADLPMVCDLLNEASLPTAGLAEHRGHLYVLAAQRTVVGVVSYEAYSPNALLRSLVIAPAARGQEHGRQLLVFILERARRDGIRDAYALTTTIPDLLFHLGFNEVKRSDAPAALLASEEFRWACPASARLFRISVTPGSIPLKDAAKRSRKKGART
jgi:cystathionine beta-synthase